MKDKCMFCDHKDSIYVLYLTGIYSKTSLPASCSSLVFFLSGNDHSHFLNDHNNFKSDHSNPDDLSQSIPKMIVVIFLTDGKKKKNAWRQAQERCRITVFFSGWVPCEACFCLSFCYYTELESE